MDFLGRVFGRMNGFLYRCRADENYTMLEMAAISDAKRPEYRA